MTGDDDGGVETLLGIALGCIGMSMQDFCQCTPSEFKAIFDAWQLGQQQREHSEWERVRMQCLCSLQPYSAKHLQAADIMQFPWEKNQVEENTRQETREEIIARMEETKRRWGLK